MPTVGKQLSARGEFDLYLAKAEKYTEQFLDLRIRLQNESSPIMRGELKRRIREVQRRGLRATHKAEWWRRCLKESELEYRAKPKAERKKGRSTSPLVAIEDLLTTLQHSSPSESRPK